MDIQKITSDLIATGLTQHELAGLVPCSQSAINAFLNGNRGARPTYLIGKRLNELHLERCGKKVAPPTKRRRAPAAPP